jgi:hypothetical protein
MLHACVERFDVMGVRGNILGWDEEVKKRQSKIIFLDSLLNLLCSFLIRESV